jgi:phage shock protein PspC (stress-responsive transcriptional regulator)
MWAGVAGGMADYFEIDPALVRLLWVAATVVTGGLAIPAYILLWIILPRDDRPAGVGPNVWHDWSEEFHSETQRLAAEARQRPEDVHEAEPWWQSEGYAERHRHHGRHPRSTGIVLVALGILLLAANAGFFTWVEWKTMWPLIFIGLGLILLARQTGWGR